jgi:hypothetical protein
MEASSSTAARRLLTQIDETVLALPQGKIARLFPRRAASHDGLQAFCKACFKVQKWREQGINITTEQYEQFLEEQDGRCAICRKPPRDQALHVDHDHETSAIRGLLCRRCNRGIGAFETDPLHDETSVDAGVQRLLRAIVYLAAHTEHRRT